MGRLSADSVAPGQVEGPQRSFIHLSIGPELPYAKRIKEEREEQLERRVMGESYSGEARGKIHYSKTY